MTEPHRVGWSVDGWAWASGEWVRVLAGGAGMSRVFVLDSLTNQLNSALDLVDAAEPEEHVPVAWLHVQLYSIPPTLADLAIDPDGAPW